MTIKETMMMTQLGFLVEIWKIFKFEFILYIPNDLTWLRRFLLLLKISLLENFSAKVTQKPPKLVFKEKSVIPVDQL